MSAARALLGGLIDHAPLFPPASLPLAEALEDHARALASPHSWMVNRFVCPASRLGELGSRHLRLTLVMDGPIGAMLADERIEALEGRDPQLVRSGLETYVEVPPDADLAKIRATGARAKVRCGPEAPSVEALAGFVRRCRAFEIPFKATAGLHHAVRSNGQHGFLNLLAAAVFGDEELALEEDDPAAFTLGSEFRWRDRSASAQEVAGVRRSLFASVGSCSFTEPVEELEALGVL
jgi:hypothetical protein